MTGAARAFAIVTLLVVTASRLGAQDRAGLMEELIKDVTDLETKIVGLARAMPDTAYAWRPAAGVRSSHEVFVHIAVDNYLLPGLIGAAQPTADTGIEVKDRARRQPSMEAFEKRPRTREQVVAELERSFAHLKAAMASTTDASLQARPTVSIQQVTSRQMWVQTVSHMHEHLGQLIAYARSNGVKPPWSK